MPHQRDAGIPDRRDAAIDALRTAVTLLVVLHHSVLAYAAFGHFDPKHYLWSTAPIVDDHRWIGFDLVILFNDGWFMAAMFAIAGLFVLPGLRRYGAKRYLYRRVLRLGLPFVIAALLLMPLAYYPSFMLTGASISYWQFWTMTIMDGPWSAGPAWFLWVLLVFDAAAVGSVALSGPPAGAVRSTWLYGLIVIAALGSVASLFAFGSARWFAAGPFAVQASRIVLYATSFAAGVMTGPRLAEMPVRGRPIVCLCGFAALIALTLKRSAMPADLWCVFYGVTLVAFCFTTGLSALALARRLPQPCVRALQRMGPDAFWIYVTHYLPLIWLQYALLRAEMPAIAKAALVFAATLGVSWAAAASIRVGLARLRPHRIPSTSIIS